MSIQPELTSSWSEIWYPDAMHAFMQIVGVGHKDLNTGNNMPNFSSLGTLSLLGLVTPAVASALERYTTDFNEMPKSNVATHSNNIESDGKWVWQKSGLSASQAASPGQFINAKTYLSYTTDVTEIGLVSGSPWIRYPPGQFDFTGAWEIFYIPSVGDNPSYHQFVRQMIADWQRMVHASAACISANSSNTALSAPQVELSEFLSALRSLCSDLDVLNENPPELLKISDAIRHSLSKTSEFVGKAAADISSEVGKQAGIIGSGLTEGFLANAGILSFIVVGIVISLFLK